MQQVGTELWLKSTYESDQLDRLADWSRYRDEVIALIGSTREQLSKIYAGDSDDAGKRERKARVFAGARDEHTEIAARHEIKGGFTHWFAGELNNAKIGSVAAYNSLTPAFINMIRAYKLDFATFYAYAEAVGDLEKSTRDSCLEAWSQNTGLTAASCPQSEVISATAS